MNQYQLPSSESSTDSSWDYPEPQPYYSSSSSLAMPYFISFPYSSQYSPSGQNYQSSLSSSQALVFFMYLCLFLLTQGLYPSSSSYSSSSPYSLSSYYSSRLTSFPQRSVLSRQFKLLNKPNTSLWQSGNFSISLSINTILSNLSSGFNTLMVPNLVILFWPRFKFYNLVYFFKCTSSESGISLIDRSRSSKFGISGILARDFRLQFDNMIDSRFGQFYIHFLAFWVISGSFWSIIYNKRIVLCWLPTVLVIGSVIQGLGSGRLLSFLPFLIGSIFIVFYVRFIHSFLKHPYKSRRVSKNVYQLFSYFENKYNAKMVILCYGSRPVSHLILFHCIQYRRCDIEYLSNSNHCLIDVLTETNSGADQTSTRQSFAQTRQKEQQDQTNQVKNIQKSQYNQFYPDQFPIELTHSTKQNHPNNHPARAASSLTHEESHMHKALRNIRVQSALSQYPEPRDYANRKRLSLDSTGKRYERDSLVSKTSHSKKMSKNSKHIQEGTRVKIAEHRKKSNVSCLSACDEGYTKTTKKHSVKQKRQSFSNLQVQLKPKGKENRSPNKNVKTGDKDRSKSKNRKKSTFQLDKSKISATAITTFDKGFIKKKQSTSAAQFGPGQKKKKKTQKKKSVQAQKPDQFSVQQYPINKYDVAYTTQQYHNPKPVRKSRSKSRKGSSSKQPKKMHSLVEIDYNSCINIPSNSSGLINSYNSKQSRASNENIKIIDNWEYRYFADENPQSFNLEEIRYYESNHYSHKKQEKQFMAKNFNNQEKYNLRKDIEEEIADDYPQFQELELKFLSSVIFIQRKWRQYRLYKTVFKNLATSDHKISCMNLEDQSNSKQLNINSSVKSPQKTEKKQNKKTEQKQQQEAYSPKFKRQLFAEEKRKEQAESSNKDKYLRNKAYLQYEQILDQEKEYLSRPSQMKEEELQDEQYELQHAQSSSRQSSNFGIIRNYQFLTNQLFPSISYLQLKQEQLKSQLHHSLKQLQQLHSHGAITNQQYKKLKMQSQIIFEREMKALGKSRKDIKKGYLSFIDTFKNIKQESGLRRVSSQNGPMSLLYSKVYNLDKTVKNSSSSSQSMKRLTKRVLIRKQFFQTQKIQPSLFDQSYKKSISARNQQNKSQDKSSYSARGAQPPMSIPDQARDQGQLCFNRIREGLVVSPQIYEISPTRSPALEAKKFQIRQNLNTDPFIIERKQRHILQEIIASLTQQLFVELIRIDEKRENAIDIIIEPQHQQLPSISKISEADIKDFQMISDTQSVEFQTKEEDQKEEDFQIVQQFKFRQIFKIEGLAERSDIVVNRKPRHSNTHNISPISAEIIPFESQEITSYAKQLFGFLTQKNIQNEIVVKLNKNQGFTPNEYLKFLRDFQIPDEEYDPLISNEVFIEWQETFYQNKDFPQEESPYSKRQAITIFHRCIFECIIGLLEDHRPSGDKGEPFPWQHIIFFKRVISLEKVPSLYDSCLANLQKIVNLKCGLIEQKQLVITQDDMERLHEQNQDRIIMMLENQLGLSPHSWYEIEQHGLEIKLEVEYEIYDFIMLEALDQMLEVL